MSPEATRWSTIDACLAEQAKALPAKTLLAFGNKRYSYHEVDLAAHELAGGLARLGVSKGDAVSVILPNCPDNIFVWMALAKLGAVTASLNTEYRGDALSHLLKVVGAEVLLVDEQFADRVAEIASQIQHVRHIVYRASAGWSPPATLAQFAASDLGSLPVPGYVHERQGLHGRDPAMLLFTSGTTGPAKAVTITHGFALDMAADVSTHFGYRADDVIYTGYPLFHAAAAICAFVASLALGATMALSDRFRASTFWDEIRYHGATITDLIGAAMVILHKRPAESSDADNPLRMAITVPTPSFYEEFEARFDLTVAESYGATEFGHPFMDPVDGPERHRVGACGKLTDRFEARIVDHDDNDAPVGELLVRPKFADQHMAGYWGDPAATVEAWRNLWYHTGDRGHFDADGWFYYEGRLSDSIRKRGNNMSAYEIEQTLNNHPVVVESAAIGVPSQYTEDDVKVVVVLQRSATLTHRALVDWCRDNMPKYMVPSYVEFADELPKNPTGKVNKRGLREDWNNARTFAVGPEAFIGGPDSSSR